MLEKYKLAAFDLDGTLVDTDSEYRYELLPPVLRKIGVTGIISRVSIDRFWLEGDRNTTITQDFRCDTTTFWDAFLAADKIEERIKYTRPDPHSQQVLIELKQQGIDLVLVTDSPPHIANPEADLLPRDLFSIVASIPALKKPAKPNPASLLYCLETREVKPSEAVYIGNSTVDGIYAAKAGVDFIHIDRSDRTEHPLLASLNARRIRSLLELINSQG